MKIQIKSVLMIFTLTLVSGVGFSKPQGASYEVVNTCTEAEPLVRGKVRLSPLTGLPVGPSFQSFHSVADKILRPFQSDGCSQSPNGVTGTSESQIWVACCVAHDTAYWKGGTFQEKEKADQELKACLGQVGYPRIVTIYGASVKQFGGPNTTQNFRWGFGWNYKRGYAPLSDLENQQIESLYGVKAQDIEAHLFNVTDKVYESCNSLDSAFTPLSSHEDFIFQDLNRKMKANTVIQAAEMTTYNLEKKTFEVRVEGCVSPIKYVFKLRVPELLSVESSCF